MAPPSPLAIATSSVNRLIKEEASYHKELKSQEARLAKLEGSTEEDENKEYALKQEVRSKFLFGRENENVGIIRENEMLIQCDSVRQSKKHELFSRL